MHQGISCKGKMVAQNLVTCLLIVGPVLVGVGIPLGLSFSYVYDAIVTKELQLTPGSQIYKQWEEASIGIYMNVYMWNWTNAEEFSQDYSIVPKFEEIGPFVFRVKTERSDLKWNDNHTVTFAPNRTYLFQPDLSVDFNTSITSLSPLPAVLAYYGRFWNGSFFAAILNQEIILREQIYKTATAAQWLFYGIEDSFLDLIVPLKQVANIPIPFDKFAWFFGRNASTTAEGFFTLFTGVDDISKVGRIDRWKGQNESTAYEGECGIIGGTTGEVISPMKEPPTTLGVFAADVCSQMALDYEGETTEEGVSGWLFKGSQRTLDDGEIYEDTSCFCTGECIPIGARNISDCKFGAPAYVSFPHFYLADESYTANIEGMNPNPEKHAFTLKVEPTTGIPLSVRAQLQVNLRLEPTNNIDMYNGLPKIYIPIMWFSESASITPDIAKLVNMILILPTVGPAVCYSLGVLGLILFGSGLYLEFRKK